MSPDVLVADPHSSTAAVFIPSPASNDSADRKPPFFTPFCHFFITHQYLSHSLHDHLRQVCLTTVVYLFDPASSNPLAVVKNVCPSPVIGAVFLPDTSPKDTEEDERIAGICSRLFFMDKAQASNAVFVWTVVIGGELYTYSFCTQ